MLNLSSLSLQQDHSPQEATVICFSLVKALTVLEIKHLSHSWSLSYLLHFYFFFLISESSVTDLGCDPFQQFFLVSPFKCLLLFSRRRQQRRTFDYATAAHCHIYFEF